MVGCRFQAKTREIDSIQQQLRDVQSTVSSLENSRGWFERALKDAEKAAEQRGAEHLQEIDRLKAVHAQELEVRVCAACRACSSSRQLLPWLIQLNALLILCRGGRSHIRVRSFINF